MEVILAAMGGGTEETLTGECAAALARCGCILGAERLLRSLPGEYTENRVAATKPAVLLEGLERAEREGVSLAVAAYSGDTGLYSGARSLLPLLEKRGLCVRVLPGVSSVQLLAARLCRPWQDWNIVSAHGVECDPVAAVSQGRPAFFLTGGALGPARLCRRLTQAGLGELEVTVGEELSAPGERISSGTAEEFSGKDFSPLSVLLAEAAPAPVRRTPGLPDEEFVRGPVPMTKQEVRAAVLAKLAVRPGDVLWDVGAGTGSVGVELALAAPRGRVFSVECREEACALTEQNRARHRAWNLTVVRGRAPQALAGLPAPDSVFIGGSGRELDAIVEAVLRANPAARICASAIALETLGGAVEALTRRGLTAQVTQLSVSRTRPAGGLHLLLANNPVFLITADREEEAP